jgi:hypothetical protein
MERTPVGSRNIAEVGFDAATGTLQVVFRWVGTYEFVDVPRAVFDGLTAEAVRDDGSSGDAVHGYFRAHVKGRYRFRRRRVVPSLS